MERGRKGTAEANRRRDHTGKEADDSDRPGS